VLINCTPRPVWFAAQRHEQVSRPGEFHP
jgi:hypothetical protein